MKRRIFFSVLFLFAFSISSAQVPALEIKHDQLSFDYLASDGGFWFDCTHKKNSQPHSWTVNCQNFKFDLHLMLVQYLNSTESTYEFHYWATESATLKQTHTQSTWLTVDKGSRTKKIIAYLGFGDDTAQLRLNLDLTK